MKQEHTSTTDILNAHFRVTSSVEDFSLGVSLLHLKASASSYYSHFDSYLLLQIRVIFLLSKIQFNGFCGHS